MDWEAAKKKRDEEIENERRELLAMNDAQAMQLTYPMRYQRIRYLREIEAAAWLAGIRRKLIVEDEHPLTKKIYKKPTKSIYEYD